MTRHNSFKSRTTGFALTTHLYPKNSPFKFLDFVPNEAGDLSLVGGICTPVDKDCWSILHVVCDIEILFTVPGGKVYDPDLQAIAEALKTLGIPYDNKIGEILPKYNGSNCFSDCWQRNIEGTSQRLFTLNLSTVDQKVKKVFPLNGSSINILPPAAKGIRPRLNSPPK